MTVFHQFVTDGHSSLPHSTEAKSEGGNTEVADTGSTIAMGKCFATIVYSQLVAESCQWAEGFPAPSTISVLFHTIIEDLSTEALKLAAMFAVDSTQRNLLKQIVQVPQTSTAEIESLSALIAQRYGR